MILHNNIFLITGVNSGIGRDLCIRLLSRGHSIIGIDLSSSSLHNIMISYGEKFVFVEHDLINNDTLLNKLREVISKIGKINGFVHVAGIPCLLPLKSLSRKVIDQVFSINTFAAIDLARICLRKEISSVEGMSNIFVSSVYSLVGSAANSVYASSKAALNGLARSLAIECAPKNIRFNVVAPGFVVTEMWDEIKSGLGEAYVNKVTALHPLGLGTPEDVSELIIFLLSKNSRWITGSTFSIDGGFSAQ